MSFPFDQLENRKAVPSKAPDVNATPEGDNEFTPDQPLPGGEMPAPPERPRGNEPHSKSEIRPALSE